MVYFSLKPQFGDVKTRSELDIGPVTKGQRLAFKRTEIVLPMTEDARKIFDEREIRAILKRAAGLQKDGGSAPQSGLSLEEIRTLALEAGIDPGYVEQAATELVEGIEQEDVKSDFFGGPFSFTFEREVAGSGSEELWESLVTAIRKTFKDSGTVRSWGKSMEWTHSTRSTEQAHVTLTDRNGKLKLQVFHKDATIPIPFYVNYFLLAVVSTGMTIGALGPVTGIPLLLAIFLPLFFLVRFGVQKLVKKKRNRAQSLTNQLVRICKDANPQKRDAAVAELPVEAKSSEIPGLIDLEESDADKDEREGKISRRERTR